MKNYYVYHERVAPYAAPEALGVYGPYAARSAKEALRSFVARYKLEGDGERLRVAPGEETT